MGKFYSKKNKEINIVLIGSTGHGKSSAGNMILEKNIFFTKASADSVTTQCQRSENEVNGKKITVIDTPDFFDTENNEAQMKEEIVRALVECAEGIHAFVLVLKVGRYTKHEKDVLQQLLNTLTEDFLKHTVILFTFGKQLEGQHIEEFVKTNSQIEELFNKCEERCLVVDSKYLNKEKTNKQKKILLKIIDTMVKENGCYSNELLKKLEESIQEEMRKNAGKPEEARNKVYETFLGMVKGLAKLSLAAAFHGVTTAAVDTFSFAEGFAGIAVRNAVAYSANYLTEQIVKGAFEGCGSVSNEGGATTSNENPISLITEAQNVLEVAKNKLETAKTVLMKK